MRDPRTRARGLALGLCAGDIALMERRHLQLCRVHSGHRPVHGVESSREPPVVPGGLGQPSQGTQRRTPLYVEPGGRAGLFRQALRFGAEACGSWIRISGLLTSLTAERSAQEFAEASRLSFCFGTLSLAPRA